MLIKTNQKNKEGKTIYFDTVTKKHGLIPRQSHQIKSNIPNGIVGRFLKPMYSQIWEGDMRKMLLHNAKV